MSSKIKSLENLKSKKSGFDFDYWRDLAKKDPSAFEVAREKEINQHIARIADENTQERLRRLQWRVEMERKLSKNPMDSAVRIYDMMWESVGKSFGALQNLTRQLTPQGGQKAKSAPQANVLEFKRAEAVVD